MATDRKVKMEETNVYKGISGIMSILRQIWNGCFHIQFFDAPFTIGDIFIALFFISLSINILRFFAHAPSEKEGEGIKYQK